jgi:hypothetical protein
MSHRFGPRTRLTGLVPSALVKNWLGRAYGLTQTVQRNTITIAAPATSNTRTITSVDTSRSIVRYLGFNSTAADASQNETNFACVLTNATTVTGVRWGGGVATSAVVGSFEVIQFATGVIKRIQVGTVTIINGSTGGTATLGTAVTVGKANLEFNGLIYENAVGLPINCAAEIVLTNSTTITATRVGTADALTVYFTVWETT